MAEDDTSARFAAGRDASDSSVHGGTAFSPGSARGPEDRLAPGSSVSADDHVAPDDKTVISKRPPPLSPQPPVAASSLLGSALVGTQLEHYRLDEFVGGGGMGAVFRATDMRLGRTVAVKVLSHDHTDEETIRRFRNEAQSAARLDHPNIARVYYVGEDRGWNFIVFEFIEGTNLRDEVERGGPLALEQALLYTLQVAEALAHSSGRDVVHRDIKPSNVLVTADGQVKLVDMGLARQHHVESSSQGDLTASGVMLGTFDYISPEQARDPREADVRSDIYSLGCTLFFMLTGQPPFPDGSAVQKLLRHNSDEPPDVRSFRPELPPRVSGLVTRMLAKRPAQRQQSAAELIAEIVALGQQLGMKSVASRVVLVPLPAQPPWWNKAAQIGAAVALLVAALVLYEVVVSPPQAGGDVMARARLKPPLDPPAPPAAPLGDAPGAASAGGFAPAAAATVPLEAAVAPEQSSVAGALAAASGTPLATSPPAAASDGPSSPGLALGGVSLSADSPPRLDRSFRDAPQPSANAPDNPPLRIAVIGEGPAPPEPQTEFAETLAEACGRAAELGVSEVELRFTGPRFESPLEIGSQRLKVRAAAGYRPQLVFRPQVQVGEPHMIRLSGGSFAHVQFEGIDVRLELPSDAPADGWALFGISTGQSLDLTSCVLTVQDGGPDEAPIHEQVAVIAVQRRRSGEVMTMNDAQLAMGQQARISLERCIARGEASLVCMTDETPLTVRWTQGLLVTSKHLIETGGSLTEPQYYEQLVLDLHQVTAYCRQGLYYLRRGPGKAHQFYVHAYADRCLFVTEVGVPLFEMVGLSIPPEEDELQSTGEGNRFSPADMPFLIVRQSPSSEPQVFKLNRRWSSETRSQAGVLWKTSPPLDRPLHELTKHDFEVADDSTGGGVGFDPLLLPETAAAAPADKP
jgi:hypothetical protein